MENEELIANNILIAKFDEWDFVESPYKIDLDNNVWIRGNHPSGDWDSQRSVSILRSKEQVLGTESLGKYPYNGGRKTKEELDAEIEAVKTEMWRSLCNPEYGRAGKYHKDWNKLMYIFNKIEAMGFTTSIYYLPKTLHCVKIMSGGADVVGVNRGTKLDAVYHAVLNFINWYNSKNNKV